MEAELRKLMMSILSRLESLTTDAKRAFSLIDQIEQSKRSPPPTSTKERSKILMMHKHEEQPLQVAPYKVVPPSPVKPHAPPKCAPPPVKPAKVTSQTVNDDAWNALLFFKQPSQVGVKYAS